ncbi:MULTISPECIES: (S)-ureidoglycine aminohydrolase [Mammaliicoccus]|jgi:(S)-ureidoglycine aminohydrolase|uniref:(S)-ureidoglycine aminohydrolase n=1 Tax=Mammaliicoccus lentus TaxID=42858 RepID=A0ABS6GXZ7_MAMLE|nr:MULTISPECIES: (S)-ureidoglycine aminohydrolase [Mammaliicoccus]MBF0749595.1 (S)-ureidoglycine aminohydrolase [Mammaliicoccus lentus]MBF0795658.1 (S)-ureidoglycine aminohydrolase [Mammaliicoccus lentus]MBF0841027.1 (S)-ureidoglycine aminohydrolase [Mammaliicoccus lentus]MBU6114311.1 (S)-ureidoglycine aminohydrolase [Mammaliicoccus lentus]MBW0763613.1 (S)-ureidoglycine aminohydrolase [Mammaliicoccus lentus]
MGYLNHNQGYREGLLETRSVIKKDNYAVITPDGLVNNVVPGFEDCDITILGSPRLGARFVDYLVTLKNQGGNKEGFGGNGVQTFIYVVYGKINAYADGKQYQLNEGGYLYVPPHLELTFENNNNGEDSRVFLYKKRYQPIEGHTPEVVTDNVNDLKQEAYEGMEEVLVQDLLPKEIAYDMNIHILSFKPGASHGYIETHVQEHGAYVLSGRGMYNLDNDWLPVDKGDYIFMGAYSPQATYAVGLDEPFAYIYSKDANRDIEI